jgi:hypothetical protein
MRRAGVVVLGILVGLLSGCQQWSEKGPRQEGQEVADAPAASSFPAAQMARDAAAPAATQAAPRAGTTALPAFTERKVIRNAEFTMELDNPVDGKLKIEAIAEACGGFVVTSEVTGSDAAGAQTAATVVVRVPAAKFASALEQVRKLGYRIRRERITGQDVTEEYIDLEARLKAKQALEVQYLEIMKRAAKVSEALEVQQALGEVRAEIEQMEGRRRFLENQVNLSTLTVNLQSPAALVATSGPGFVEELKRAFGEGFDAALGFVFGFIRFVLVLIPFVILVVLPAWYLWRRLRARRPAAVPVPQEAMRDPGKVAQSRARGLLLLFMAILLEGEGNRTAETRELDLAAQELHPKSPAWLRSRIGASYARAGAGARAQRLAHDQQMSSDPRNPQDLSSYHLLEGVVALARGHVERAASQYLSRSHFLLVPVGIMS